MSAEAFCPVCECHFSILLGQLGNFIQLRCRDCGFVYSVRA
jgi:translation initiation factor 2 beta subunit (eIF-2beta)/eIF-5